MPRYSSFIPRETINDYTILRRYDWRLLAQIHTDLTPYLKEPFRPIDAAEDIPETPTEYALLLQLAGNVAEGEQKEGLRNQIMDYLLADHGRNVIALPPPRRIVLYEQVLGNLRADDVRELRNIAAQNEDRSLRKQWYQHYL